MASIICEWDQFVILDPEDGSKNYNKKKYNNSSSFYYGHKKYSDINPLDMIEEEGDYNESDDKIFKSLNDNTVNIQQCIYWGDILVKSVFTGCMVYVLFIV